MEEQPIGIIQPLTNVEDIMWLWFFDYHKQPKSSTTGDIVHSCDELPIIDSIVNQSYMY